MKVKVTVPVFKDKLTGIYHKEGATFDVSQERFDEIRKAGPFVEPVRQAKNGTSKKDADEKQGEDAPAEEPEPDPAPSTILETDSGMSFEPTERRPGH